MIPKIPVGFGDLTKTIGASVHASSTSVFYNGSAFAWSYSYPIAKLKKIQQILGRRRSAWSFSVCPFPLIGKNNDHMSYDSG